VGDSQSASVHWRKSTASGANGDCVEVAANLDSVLIRNSQHPSGPVLSFSHREWAAFMAGARDGEFDFSDPSSEPSTFGDSSI